MVIDNTVHDTTNCIHPLNVIVLSHSIKNPLCNNYIELEVVIIAHTIQRSVLELSVIVKWNRKQFLQDADIVFNVIQIWMGLLALQCG